MQRLRGTAGFTLIEIMVVVFILGLLVTLVAPKIIGRTDEARRTKALADTGASSQCESKTQPTRGCAIQRPRV